MFHNKKSFITIFLLFSVLFVSSLCIKEIDVKQPISIKTSPHNDREKHFCSLCHLDNSIRLSGPSSELCLRCHPAGKNDHPINVELKGDKKTWLPLDEKQRISCHTCHDPHNNTQFPSRLRSSFNNICIECHSK